jgi:D-alanyl-lipoteichoic acid acyltransferase DltB (MBOAT superfamily)
MNTDQKGVGERNQPQRRWLTLAQYIRRRNGVPLGSAGSLRNMLRRSLGAGSFAGFWQYWNPVWGYGLARYVYSPLKRVLPTAAALIMTFVVCGALHDLVIIAIRGSATFLFTPWFFLLGVGVVFGRAVGMDFSSRPWLFRACVNFTYVGACLAVTLVARRVLAIP